MPLKSDLQLDAAKFAPSAVSDKTNKFNEQLIKVMEGGPRWYEVGAEKYRHMRWNGETPLPKPVVLDSAQTSTLPSRSTHTIPTRIFHPDNNDPARGLFLHIHGGGWVLQSEAYQDALLSFLANHCSLIVLSIGYRLAPEHPFPAANHDCVDAASYLVDHAERDYGVPLLFVGGDSAGAHLAALAAFELLESRPAFAFKGLVLNFGAFDLAGFLPQVHHFEVPLVLDGDIMEKYIQAYLPNTTETQRRDPSISPLYANLNKMKLPPALFTCGTLDCLLDDTIMMGAKWAMSGAEAVVKIYPGAPHGFVFFPVGSCDETQEALDDIKTFLTEKI